jgi:hypothetical protein
MDLSSADSTPNTSPVPATIELPKEGSNRPLQDRDSLAMSVAFSSLEELAPNTTTPADPALTPTGIDSASIIQLSAMKPPDHKRDPESPAGGKQLQPFMANF